MGGRIYPWGEPMFGYPNANWISTIDLFFTLDTQLPIAHVLRATFPFSTKLSISSIQIIPVTAGQQVGQLSQTISGATAFSSAGITQTSSAPFHNYIIFPKALAAAQAYRLRITLSQSPADTGFLGYLQLETLSPTPALIGLTATSETPLTYDINNAFAPIHIFAAPNNPGVFTAITNDTNAQVANATYVVPIKIAPSNDFWPLPTITIVGSNANFPFTSCINADTGVSASQAVPLPASQYNCSISGTTITIYHNQALFKNQTLIYNVSVTNPAYAGQTTLNLYITHRYNKNLTDVNTNSVNITFNGPTPGITTAAPAINNNKVLLSWGIDPAIFSSSYQSLLKIYHIKVATSATLTTSLTSASYQGLIFQWGMTNLPSQGTYTVTLSICGTTVNCDVLENSISHSFGVAASCSLTASTSGVKVTCTGITALTASNNFIGARTKFYQPVLTTGSSISDGAFGNIAIQYTISGVTTSISSPALSSVYKNAALDVTQQLFNNPIAGLTNAAVALSQTAANAALQVGWGNGPLIGTADATVWSQIKAITDFTVTVGTTSPSLYSLYGAVFGANTTSTYYLSLQGLLSGSILNTNFAFPGAAANTLKDLFGVDLFLNPNIFSVTPAFDASKCQLGLSPSAGTTPATATIALHCQAVNFTAGTNKYTRLRQLVVGTLATDTITFTDPGTTGKMATFIWEQFVTVQTFYGCSLRADSNVNDYYVAVYQLANSLAPATIGYSKATKAGTNISDLGELGSAGIQASAHDGLYTCVGAAAACYSSAFFTQYMHPPNSTYSGINVWWSGYNSLASTDPSKAVILLRARGAIGVSEYKPASGKVAVFLRNLDTTAATTFLPPSPTSSNSAGTVRCFTATSISTCSSERAARAFLVSAAGDQTNYLNPLDTYQIVSGTADFSGNFSITFLANPNIKMGDIAQSAGTMYRVGFVGANGYYWIPYLDQPLGGLPPGSSTPTTPVSGTPALATAYQPVKVTCNTTTGASSYPVQINLNSGDTDQSLIASEDITIIGTNANFSSQTSIMGLGSVIWCTQFDFRGQGVLLSNQGVFELTYDKCQLFDYYAQGASSPASMYCLFCPIAGTSIPQTVPIHIQIKNFKSPPAVDIHQPMLSQISNDYGYVWESSYCPYTYAGYLPANLQVQTSGTYWALQGGKLSIGIGAVATIGSVSKFTVSGFFANGTSDSNFPYASLDSNSACYMVPTVYIQNIPQNTYTCTVTGTNTLSFTWSGISTADQAQKNWTLVIWGFNGNLTNTNNVNQSYFQAQTLTSGVSGGFSIVDQSAGYQSWPLNTINTTLRIASMQYQRPYLNARGYFKWDFSYPPQRAVFYKDRLVFNLDAIISSSINNNASIIRCQIIDSSTGAINQQFQSCTLSSTAVVLLPAAVPTVSPYDFSFGVLSVYLYNAQTVQLQTIQTIYGTVQFQASTPTLTKSNAGNDIQIVTIPSNQTFGQQPIQQQWWTHPAGLAEYQFSMPTSQPFNESCRITIVFPSYFNPYLSTRSVLFCRVNDIPTFCQVNDMQTLTIQAFPAAVAANNTLIVKVQGIEAPVSTYTSEFFWFQINQDWTEALANVTSAGIMQDVSKSAQDPTLVVKGLNVVWFNSTSQQTRTLSTNTWSFYLTNMTATIDSTRALQVIFPPTWYVKEGLSIPSCQVSLWGNTSQTYTGSGSPSGHVITLPFTSALPNQTVFSLTCNNLRTPDYDGTYPSQDIRLRILDVNGTNVYYYSAPGEHNLNYSAAYTRGAALTYIDWISGSAATSISYSQVLAVTRGTYSTPITLNIPGRSSLYFQVQSSNGNFTVYPNPMQVTLGYQTVTGRLGCSGGTPLNKYAVTFSISDSSMYTIPQSLLVSVNTTQVSFNVNPPVTTAVTTILVPGVGTKTNPVVIDASQNVPYADITVTPTFPATNGNFSVVPSSITLTPNAPTGSFVFITTGSTTSNGQVQVTYAITGTNQASYLTPAPQTIQIVSDTANAAVNRPILAIGMSVFDQNAATSKLITFNLTKVTAATIYWVVAPWGTNTQDANGIAGSALSPPVQPVNGLPASVYGITAQQATPFSPTFVTVTGLMPSTIYEVRAFANSYTQLNSSVVSYSFTTNWNSAVPQRWLFNFTTFPTSSIRQTLLCGLSQQLQIPVQNIRAISGEICGNTSMFYFAANSTGTLAVYFYPLPLESDPVLPKLSTTLQSLNLLATLNNSITGGNTGSVPTSTANATANATVGFFNVTYDGGVDANVVATFPVNVSTSVNSVTIKGCTLSDRGFIYAAVINGSLQYIPTGSQVKQALFPIIQTTTTNTTNTTNVTTTQVSSLFTQVQVLYFDPNMTASVDVSFIGLKANTIYSVYLAAGNNDPSFSQNFTTVTVLQAQTLPGTPTYLHANLLSMVLLLAIMSVISLLLI